MNQMESVLKRVDKHLNYFAYAITGDKFLVVLIILIAAAIVAVFIISFFVNKDKSQWNDIIHEKTNFTLI